MVITSDELINCVWKNADNKLTRLATVTHGTITGIRERPSAIAFSPDDKELAFGIEAAIALIDVKSMDVVRYLGSERPRKEPEITLEDHH